MTENTGSIQHDPASRHARGARKTPPRTYSKSGLNTLKRRLKVRGMAGIDKRCRSYRLLTRGKDALVADLGGEDNLSAQEKVLVDGVIRTQLLLDAVDGFLIEQASIVNKVRRSVWPVVRERIQLQDSLLRLLLALGLERRQREVPTLTDYLRQRAAELEQQHVTSHPAPGQPQPDTEARDEG